MNPKSDNHSFSVAVATTLSEIGSAAIEKAIILKEFYNLCSWRVEQGMTVFGLGWWYASAENLSKKFPYMNGKSIQRWLRELEEKGFLYSVIMNEARYDKTKSYTVNFNCYDSLAQNEYSLAQNEQWIAHIAQLIAQDEQPIHSPNNSKEDTNISCPSSTELDDTPKFYLEFEQTIVYLNEKTGRNFQVSKQDAKGKTDKFKKFAAIMKQYTLEDMKAVIDNRCYHWLLDVKMSKYICPATLFVMRNFEKYLDDVRAGAIEIKDETDTEQPFIDTETEKKYTATKDWILRQFPTLHKTNIKQLSRAQWLEIFGNSDFSKGLEAYMNHKQKCQIMTDVLTKIAVDTYAHRAHTTLYNHFIKALKDYKAMKLKQRS